MKSRFFLKAALTAVVFCGLALGLAGCGGPKVLIAYYSQGGNTRAVAEQIQAKFGGELFEITLAEPYPASEGETIAVAGRQREAGTLPQLAGAVPDLADYDVVFIGTPIWFGTASLPMLSFVKACQGAAPGSLAGTTVVPFYTCGGGDAGSYVADITPFLPGATILEPFGNNRAEREAGTHTAKVAAYLDKLSF